MIQIKTFTDTLHASAEIKANRFLDTLEASQYIETKYALIQTGEPHSFIKRSILIVYHAKPGAEPDAQAVKRSG
ncbi:hypothetical protein PV433_09015 [Paenibacillus sp. GYB004]|uniref:hypothetical protein n=1 Tax=Paenibacillus sp. GYB004 TaxID=2994393 RepID=UPI002F9625B5